MIPESFIVQPPGPHWRFGHRAARITKENGRFASNAVKLKSSCSRWSFLLFAMVRIFPDPSGEHPVPLETNIPTFFQLSSAIPTHAARPDTCRNRVRMKTRVLALGFPLKAPRSSRPRSSIIRRLTTDVAGIMMTFLRCGDSCSGFHFIRCYDDRAIELVSVSYSLPLNRANISFRLLRLSGRSCPS